MSYLQDYLDEAR